MSVTSIKFGGVNLQLDRTIGVTVPVVIEVHVSAGRDSRIAGVIRPCHSLSRNGTSALIAIESPGRIRPQLLDWSRRRGG